VRTLKGVLAVRTTKSERRQRNRQRGRRKRGRLAAAGFGEFVGQFRAAMPFHDDDDPLKKELEC
jgi:hypothetical protein